MRASISEGEYISGALPRQNRLSKLQHDRSPDPKNICVKNRDKLFFSCLRAANQPSTARLFSCFLNFNRLHHNLGLSLR
jgi:hypothetical protein